MYWPFRLLADSDLPVSQVEHWHQVGYTLQERCPESGMSPVHFAARGHPRNLEYLLSLGVSPYVKGAMGWSPLYYAAQFNCVDNCKILVRYGCVNEPSDFGNTPLMIACELGAFDVIDLLVDQGASLDLVNSIGKNCLVYIATSRRDRKDQERALVKLLQAGADPQMQCDDTLRREVPEWTEDLLKRAHLLRRASLLALIE